MTEGKYLEQLKTILKSRENMVHENGHALIALGLGVVADAISDAADKLTGKGVTSQGVNLETFLEEIKECLEDTKN